LLRNVISWRDFLSATRVHLLATELGVKSKAIIDKCKAEGLENITNHMSTISAGLAATIREWFTEGEHSTTVESADKVDLEKVRVKRKRKTKEAASEEESVQADIAVEMQEIVPPVVEVAVVDETPPLEHTVVETLPEAEVSEVPVVSPVPVEPPKPPEPIMPAGPMLEKPTPAQLSGPRIVRVEAPEPEHERPTRGKPRPSIGRPPVGRPSFSGPSVSRAPTRPRFDQPATEPLMPDVKEGAKGKKSSKERTHGRRQESEEEAAARKNKLAKWRERDMEERRLRLEAAGGESLRMRPSRKIESKHHAEAAHLKPEKVTVYEPITVKDLAAAMGVKIAEVMSRLMQQGVMATANQAINTDTAELLAIEFGRELVITKRQTLEEQIAAQFKDRSRENLVKRSPVVTVLGHVDHGKTSLLDRIRNASVAKGEAGGITQHIGAYQIITAGDKRVTFLDTPGHEAFTAMRARGANMTDVVVLVVAADDGVMPQTIEAIHHAKAAGVPIIVALNKIDLPGIDTNRIYGQLAEHELSPTEWGGKTEVVKTSAVTGQGVNELLEYLDYTSELLELKADNEIPATGWVVEAKMTPNQGPVATVLIKEGKLSKGDIVLAGAGYGRVRSIKDSYGKSIKTASSSMPVEISGLSDVPQAGDRFYCLDDINKAKNAAEENKFLSREEALVRRSQVTLDNLFTQIAAGKVKELNLIIRADVQGSVDVLIKYLGELSTSEVKIKILHAAVGGITEGDVVLAEASNAIIIGFNVIADVKVAQIAESKGVDMRFYNIIYRITEDLKNAMVGLLEPEKQEKVLGRVQVRNTFKITGVGTVAGCYVTSGVVTKSARVRLTRSNIVLKDDLKIDSLKHFKDDVREVKTGFECGIKLAGYDDIKVDDVFEIYEIIEVARTL
jgi:translation initiation factor IF-2